MVFVTLREKPTFSYLFYPIVTDASRVSEAKDKITAQVPNAIVEDESAGAMIFQFPISSTFAIPAFVKYLDTQSDGLVRAWSISHSSLEEVFLVRFKCKLWFDSVSMCAEQFLKLNQQCHN